MACSYTVKKRCKECGAEFLTSFPYIYTECSTCFYLAETKDVMKHVDDEVPTWFTRKDELSQ